MKKINLHEIPEQSTTSPKGKFSRNIKDISIALGRQPQSTDMKERQPFDVQVCRIPPGTSRCPYHLHTAQWEFYHVLSGTGAARHEGGQTKIEAGDSFIFAPEEPHQLLNDGTEDLTLLIVADNPIGESCYYPDSKKWLVMGLGGHIIRSEELDYLDGEE